MLLTPVDGTQPLGFYPEKRNIVHGEVERIKLYRTKGDL